MKQGLKYEEWWRVGTFLVINQLVEKRGKQYVVGVTNARDSAADQYLLGI